MKQRLGSIRESLLRNMMNNNITYQFRIVVRESEEQLANILLM